MDTADKVIGYLLTGGVFLMFTVINYRILFLMLKKAERIPSPAPFIGGIAGAVMMIAAFGYSHPWLILLPLLIDPGSIPLVIWFIICLFMDFRHKK